MGGNAAHIHPLPTLLWRAGDELENSTGPLNAFTAFVSLITGFIHQGIFSTGTEPDTEWVLSKDSGREGTHPFLYPMHFLKFLSLS